MEHKQKNLRSMLAQAKNLSKLMVDLSYASLYFDSDDMAEEVLVLEDQMTELVRDMRTICIVAVRNPAEAEGMAGILQVVNAIEQVANDAVDISKIITQKLGIPEDLVTGLAMAEEVYHRVVIPESLAGQSVAPFIHTDVRIKSIRRGKDWITEVDSDAILSEDDVLILVGSREGLEHFAEMTGTPAWAPSENKGNTQMQELSKALEILIEMKNISSTAVALAYSALVLGDKVLALEVRHLGNLVDEMRSDLELWIVRAAREVSDPDKLPGLFRLAAATENIGDQAYNMIQMIEREEEIPPILGIALEESQESAVRYSVRKGSRAAGTSLKDLALGTESGFRVLAIRKGSKYVYRPKGGAVLEAEDEIIASGRPEDREHLAEILGWRLVREENETEGELVPIS